jgi:hypothetical protein
LKPIMVVHHLLPYEGTGGHASQVVAFVLSHKARFSTRWQANTRGLAGVGQQTSFSSSA